MEMTPDRPLVIRGAAGIEGETAQVVVGEIAERSPWPTLFREPAAEDRFEGVGLEPSRRRNRLGVVVTVDQHRARRAGHAALTEDEGVATGFEKSSLEAAGPQDVGQPLGGDAHLRR